MNLTLEKFCEVELRALSIYKEKYTTKDQLYDQLLAEFGNSYKNVILLAIEAAAEASNFHHDVGPWMRDLKEKAGHFTLEDLKSTRIYVKSN